MTSNDILLAITLAAMAVGITVIDLIVSSLRSRPRNVRPRLAMANGQTTKAPNETGTDRRDAIRRRLAAIQSSTEPEET